MRRAEDGKVVGGLLLLLVVEHRLEQVVHLVLACNLALTDGENEGACGLHKPHEVAHGLAEHVTHGQPGDGDDAALTHQLRGQALKPAVVHAQGKHRQDLTCLPTLLASSRQQGAGAVHAAPRPPGVHEELQGDAAAGPQEVLQHGAVLQLPQRGRLHRQLRRGQAQAAVGPEVREARGDGTLGAGLEGGHDADLCTQTAPVRTEDGNARSGPHLHAVQRLGGTVSAPLHLQLSGSSVAHHRGHAPVAAGAMHRLHSLPKLEVPGLLLLRGLEGDDDLHVHLDLDLLAPPVFSPLRGHRHPGEVRVLLRVGPHVYHRARVALRP
mmetsp:Transcript_69427/g.215546  ORF Transcript_69427/g.215546 Transcript_69427/m.215546 type:complete len:324 (+) Transcript_69427:832-1803(+)